MASDTVLVKTRRLFRAPGQIVIRVFIRVYRAALDEVDGLIQHAGVPCVQNIAARRQRQPEVIIGAMRTHTPTQWRMPPMLDISFLELTGRAKEQVVAHQERLGVNERHHVLQLIAEAEGAPGLVISASRPKAARQGLVQKPAVREHVEGLVGRFHMHSAESMIPILPHLIESLAGGS